MFVNIIESATNFFFNKKKKKFEKYKQNIILEQVDNVGAMLFLGQKKYIFYFNRCFIKVGGNLLCLSIPYKLIGIYGVGYDSYQSLLKVKLNCEIYIEDNDMHIIVRTVLKILELIIQI